MYQALDSMAASYRLARAICSSDTNAEDHYSDIERIVQPFDVPAVFWRKWFRTPGWRREGNHLVPVRLTDVAGMHTVFVDRMVSANSYLIDGIELARQYGALVVIVITHRFLFTDEELERLHGQALRVLVTHPFGPYQKRIEALCPGTFMPFPHVG